VTNELKPCPHCAEPKPGLAPGPLGLTAQR